MSYTVPQNRKRDLGRVLDALSRADTVLLTTHINADGDGTGCEVAVLEWLRTRGKRGWIVNPTPFPESYAFLLPQGEGSLDPGSRKAQELASGADLLLVLDTGERHRIGGVMELAGALPTVVIDHHPMGSEPIEGVSLRDPEASATGELVFDLFQESGIPLSPVAALGLYVAVLTDTGSFRFSNATPGAHQVAAALIQAGVDPEETHRRVYGSFPRRKLRLLQASLAELEVDPGGEVAWMTIPTRAYDELSATAEDVEGLVDYPRAIRGVRVGLLFRETAKGHTKVSFRSNGPVDVNRVARSFGGGGHVRAAGAVVEEPLALARARVVEATLAAVRDTSRDQEEGE